MRCFLPCFSSSKCQNHFSESNAISVQPTHHHTDLEESIHWISESKIENEEKSQRVNNIDDPETNKNTLNDEKEEYSDSLFSVSIGCGKPVSKEENAENEVNSTPVKLHRAKDESGSTPIVPLKEPKSEEQPNETKDLGEKARVMNKSILEYRCGDCSDDDINLDDDLYNEKTGEEVRSSESSLFSLSIDYKNCRKRNSFSLTEKEVDNEVSSIMVSPEGEESEGNNILDDVCFSLLNPIENVNLVKVKVVKATMLHSAKKDKENMNWIQAETSLKLSLSNRKMKENEEIGVVDTSLSSWLVG